jgi:hypothetical protein
MAESPVGAKMMILALLLAAFWPPFELVTTTQ